MNRVCSVLGRWMVVGLLLVSLPLQAVETDSVRVERLLACASRLPTDSCRTLFFARNLLGVPYVAGTLEGNEPERLVVSLQKLDCTTFVETVVALVECSNREQCSFADFKKNLIRVRYRDGKINGYASRLHYFSDWIRENEQQGIVSEQTGKMNPDIRVVSLNFMTTHPESYPVFQKSSSTYEAMKEIEQKWVDFKMPYIPKSRLISSPDSLDIRDGDIIVFTTSVAGLDVSHVGFACRVGAEIHLLHASSRLKQVIIEPRSLSAYLQSQEAITGIRILRVNECLGE